MRLDKYLKLSRLVRRRAIAREMVEVGAVRINERTAKPSSSVAAGDILQVAYPRRILKIKILSADETALKKKTEPYELVEERSVKPEELPW